MKTVINAVNEFKGVWPYSDSLVMYYFSGTNGYGYYSKESDYNGVTAFTSEKFNQCVDEMATNHGRHPHTYAEHKAAQEHLYGKIKPVAVPTFTQEMADDGVLPSVGMECLASRDNGVNWFNFRVDYVGGVYIIGQWFDKDREASFAISVLIFKPLTPPIELISGKAYEFELSFGDIWIGYYNKSRDSFFSDLLRSNKICGKSEASNFQLFEVKS